VLFPLIAAANDTQSANTTQCGLARAGPVTYAIDMPYRCRWRSRQVTFGVDGVADSLRSGQDLRPRSQLLTVIGYRASFSRQPLIVRLRAICGTGDPTPNFGRFVNGSDRPYNRPDLVGERVGELGREECIYRCPVSSRGQGADLTGQAGDVGDADRPVVDVMTSRLAGEANLDGTMAERLEQR
jgi:hypothetical protein